VQVLELPATHAPDWQMSAWVHALPSLHEAPSVLSGSVHWPVEGSQVPTS
jgi:hypothetical protein